MINKSRNFFNYSIVFIGFLSLLLIIYFILFPSRVQYHSDCTDTIMWAQASYDAKALFNPNFNYACFLPFGGQLYMLPFIPIFGVSLITHNIGMILFTLSLYFAGYLLFRSMDWDCKSSFLAIGTVFMTLSSSEKLRELFWGHIIYYSLGILFLFVGLTLIFNHMNHLNAKKTSIFLFLCLFIWTVLCATNGLQSFIIYILPVVGALTLERYLDFNIQLGDRKNHTAYYLLLNLLFATALGFLLMIFLTHNANGGGYANGYSTYASMDQWVDNLAKFFPHWFCLLGVEIQAKSPLVSVTSICNMIRLAYGCLLLILPVVALLRYKKIANHKLRILILSHFILSTSILYAYILGYLSAANWRLSPIVCTSTVVTIAYIKEAFHQKMPRRISIVLLLIVLAGNILPATTILSLPTDYRKENRLYTFIEILEELDLNYGYASFWNANAVTVLTNSKITVRPIEVNENGIVRTSYQAQTTWFHDVDGQEDYFLVLNATEMNTLKNTGNKIIDDAMKIVQTGEYTILIFDHNLF